MSKKKNRISKRRMEAIRVAVPKKVVRPHKPYKPYEKHHRFELEQLEKKIPGAISAVESAKEEMDDAIRRAKRSAAYKRGEIWVPKKVMRIKELEQYAAFYEKDRKGKSHLQSGLDKIAYMGKVAKAWGNGGYVTMAQIEFMSERLGIDIDEMLNYNLLEMSYAIYQTYETALSADERGEFGYVEIGRERS